MKNAWVVALLVVAGCSSSPEPQAQSNQPANPGVSPKDQRINALRAEIAGKRAEVAKADAEVAQVAAEREKLNTQPAGEEKNNRLVELARVESEANARKASLNSDIAARQQELQDLVGGGQRAKSADEALDSALEADAKREAELAAARKAKEDAARGEEARKVAAAEAARIAEEEARKRETVQGGRTAPAGEDGPLFEERWADVLLKVRIELQKYKRW
jgi:colicin import membrane protein